MFRRRRVSIGREGLYYVFVLTFIVGGATLRDVNLLFILAGMMIGPLLFNWRMVVQTVRRLDVHRRLPEQVFAGRAFHVELRGHNRHWRMAGWTMVIEDPIVPLGDDAESKKVRAAHRKGTYGKVVLPFISAGESGTGSYRLVLPRRGRYRFGPCHVFTRFPLGLVRASAEQGTRESLIVCPRIGELEPSWLNLIDSDSFGHHQMHYQQGPIDGDYYGLREWRPGDSRRWIHWRTTARIGRLAVRQFEQQQNRDLLLILDLWQPESPTDEERGRTEYAISLAATMVDDLTRQGGGRMTLAQAAQQEGIWTSTLSGMFVQQIMDRLALAEPCSDDRLEGILNDSITGVRHGARVLVVSTRPARLESMLDRGGQARMPRMRRLLDRVVWIDVNDPGVSEFFHLA